VILIEVVQLVVDVNGGVDILFDHQGEFAVGRVYLVYSTVGIVLSVLDLLNLVTHDVKNDAQAQEHKAEDGEDNHRGTERRDWSPGRKHLLLEATGFELLDLLLDLLALLLCDIHLFLFK
jgi:hypothetical protein